MRIGISVDGAMWGISAPFVIYFSPPPRLPPGTELPDFSSPLQPSPSPGLSKVLVLEFRSWG